MPQFKARNPQTLPSVVRRLVQTDRLLAAFFYSANMTTKTH